MAPLRIRNLTSAPLRLTLLERFSLPALSSPEPAARNITSSFNALLTNTTSAASPKASKSEHPALSDAARPHTRESVSVPLPPFQTTTTALNVSSSEVVRIHVEFPGGERHRVDLPTPTAASTTFITSSDDRQPKKLNAVYHARTSHLAIFPSSNLRNWMGELQDSTPLSGLSIPGTHNSPTHHRALPSVRCQAVSPRNQLLGGVRFFDVRVQPESPSDPSKDSLILVHGLFPISLTGTKYFRDLVNDVLEFLRDNPSETVVMSVKREGPGQHTDAQLSRILEEHYTRDANDWWTQPTVPTLGSARKKIVLMRRFYLSDSLKQHHDGKGYALNAEIWAYNTPSDICPGGGICVQDFCEVLHTKNVAKKIRYSQEHLERAGCRVYPLLPGDAAAVGPPEKSPPLYLNFLSATNFWKVGCWPEKIAAKINPAMVEWLTHRHHDQEEKRGDGGTGIVVCDWVGKNGDWDLVRCIIGFNAGREVKEKAVGL